MAFKNLSKERQQEIRFLYRARQRGLAKDWERKKREAGLAHSVRMTEEARDRVLFRRIERMGAKHKWYCTRAVALMSVGMPMSARLMNRTDHNNKKLRHRHRMKAEAIVMMGGCCCRCGFDDPRALEFDHVQSLRRGLNGLGKNVKSGYATHSAVLRGESDNIQLLCANCHAIKTSEDETLPLNSARQAPWLNVVVTRQGRFALS